MRNLNKRQKQAVAAIVVGGGAAGLAHLRRTLRAALVEQQRICCSVGVESKRRPMPKVAVDAVFAKRLTKILKICVPSPYSYEAGLIYLQTTLLVARTLLTDVSSKIEGGVGRFIIAGDRPRLYRLLALFCGVAVPGAVVNSSLKYLQKLMKLAFMRRLTHVSWQRGACSATRSRHRPLTHLHPTPLPQHLHANYFNHRAYYAANWLGGLR